MNDGRAIRLFSLLLNGWKKKSGK
jgi:hypothetical protein